MGGNNLVKLCCLVLLILICQSKTNAQDNILKTKEYDIAYVDSIYALSLKYVTHDRMLDKGKTLVEKGLVYTVGNEYDHARFTYVKGMIYFFSKDVKDDNVRYHIFVELIKSQPKELSPEYRELIGICHQKIAWLDRLARNEKGMLYHCNKSLELLGENDFEGINSVYYILEDYHRGYDDKLSQYYVFKRLMNFMKEYVYVLTKFSPQDEKNTVYNHMSGIYQDISYVCKKKMIIRKPCISIISPVDMV